MEIRYPKYYREFSCIAAACPDSCCQQWQVDVDPPAAALYRSLQGPLGDCLRQVMQPGEEGWASLEITSEGRCPMWRRDGLCRIQAELGHEALCATCRDFPRLRHDYGDFVELGLELSCPEAARLILSCPAPESITEECAGDADADYDPKAMSLLLQTRASALKILRDEALPLPRALGALLFFGFDVHNALAFGDPLEERDWVGQFDACPRFPGAMEEVFEFYRGLEILTPQWQALLNRGPRDNSWLPQHRAAAVYLVQRYWLQAVSDLDLMARVKFIIISCLTVRALDESPLRAAQLYSKEIENSASNVDALLDGAYESPVLTDSKLLGLLQR